MSRCHLPFGPYRTSLAVVLLATAALGACGRARAPGPAAAPVPLVIRIGADTSRAVRLGIARPARARVWMIRITPARARGIDLPPPDAASEAPGAEAIQPPRHALDASDDLKPPLLRSADPLGVPGHNRPEIVEIDVRVDEGGEVTDALWAGGSTDSARVAAATACALSMRFYPALRAGQPAPVWCRQRFEFGRR